MAIPKKGDLSVCDNWRGISLLDVFGKLFARILKQRLGLVAEMELAESQCGFRKGGKGMRGYDFLCKTADREDSGA